jgi:hypothetical protein
VLTITLGRAAAFVTGPSDEQPRVAEAPSGSPIDTGGGLIADAPATDLPSFDPVDTPVAGPTSTPAGPERSVAPAEKILAVETRGLSGVYLALIVAAALVGAAGSLFRRLAVRSPWT